MQSSAGDNYLVTEVMTATPQKLHLMLIEGALRYTERSRLHFQAGEAELALESLHRAQDIVAEMLGGLNRDAAPELVGKVAAIYVFLLRSLNDASRDHSDQTLAGAVRVLEIERDTWRQLCAVEEHGQAATAGDPALEPSPTPRAPSFDFIANDPLPGAGFSLEA